VKTQKQEIIALRHITVLQALECMTIQKFMMIIQIGDVMLQLVVLKELVLMVEILKLHCCNAQ
jgi:hypothetical protein